MLDLSRTRFDRSVETPVNATDLPNMFEGAALQLIYNTTTLVTEVWRSGTGTSQVFGGVALVPWRSISTTGFVESDVVPAGVSGSKPVVVLQNLAASSALVAVINGTTLYTQVAAGSEVAGASYSVSTVTVNNNQKTQLQFATGEAGNTLAVQYRAIYTANQSAMLFGDQYTRLAPDFTQTLSVILGGDIYTDSWDPTSVWSTTSIKITNGGIFAAQSSSLTGTNINATLIQAPTVDYPYLGIRINNPT